MGFASGALRRRRRQLNHEDSYYNKDSYGSYGSYGSYDGYNSYTYSYSSSSYSYSYGTAYGGSTYYSSSNINLLSSAAFAVEATISLFIHIGFNSYFYTVAKRYQKLIDG